MSLAASAMTSLAWRNLWRNQRRTTIMLMAIAVGVWAMIFMTALMRGMVDDMLHHGIDALPGHVQIHHPDYRDDPSINNSLPQPDSEFLEMLADPTVAGYASRLRVPAMITSERDSRGVVLLGVDPSRELSIGFDPGSIVDGRFLESENDTGIVIGRSLMRRLETGLGKRVVLMSQDPDNDVVERGFRIVGVYTAKLEAQEERYVYAGRATIQSMLKLAGRVSEIALLGHDYRDVRPVLDLAQALAPEGAEVLSWPALDPYLGGMLKVMDGFVLVWMVVIFLALSFGLVNTLMMAVFERIREIGLMQALGMKPAAILYLVLVESVLMLILGLAVGNALAVATIEALRDGIDLSAVAKGLEMMGASSVLYPALKLPDLLLANLVVIGLGVLTSLLPAWRASRYRPVEAIAKT